MEIIINSMAKEELNKKDIKDKYIKIYFGGFG